MFDRIKKIFDLDEPTITTSSISWEEWEKKCKKNKPIVYWLKEELPYYYNDYVQSPLRKLHQKIKYRTVNRYHMINTKLKPDYYDTDTRLMHGMFSLLVDFIECEKAHMYIMSHSHSSTNHKRFWHYLNPFGGVKYKRVPEAGLAHLSWEMSLLNSSNQLYSSSQANSAKDQYDLYIWWTKTRPARPDPFDVYNISEWHKINGHGFKNEHTKEQKEEKSKLYKQCDELERQYYDEDTAMMTKLINIRDHLWT